MKNNKLETALIEVGKEAEKIDSSWIFVIQEELYKLKNAKAKEDMKTMRKAATRLAALTIKFMVDEL